MPAIVEFDTIPQLFMRVAAHYEGQQRPALRFKDRERKEWVDIDWETLHRRVWSLAGYLHRRGIRPGDRVAVLAENRPEWAITDLATQLLGAINVALYTTVPASQVGYIVKDSGSRVLLVSAAIQLRKAKDIFDDCPALEEIITLTEPEPEPPSHIRYWDAVLAEGEAYWEAHAGELAALAEGVAPDDLSALIYTSGTTGQPKGVMLTHENFCTNAKAALGTVQFGPDDHHLSFLPLCHSFERTTGYTAVIACGAAISYAESVDAVSKNLPEVQPTIMISVPRLFEKIHSIIAKSVEEGSSIKKKIFHWAVGVGKKVAAAQVEGRPPGALLKAQHALAHRLVFAKLHEKLGGRVRFAVSGGAALPKEIGEFFQAAGVTIIEGYGLTETAPVLTVNPAGRPRYGTVGHVLPGITLAIQRLRDGAIVGQLVGGVDDPAGFSTEAGEILVKGPNVMQGYWNDEAATRLAIDEDGWYHTGDVGHFEDGYLCITDRIKHMIVSKGGKNIYPAPIEEQFKTVPWIEQILVVGEGREYLTALVVPDLDAVRQHAQANGLAYGGDADLLQHEGIRQLFNQEFRRYSRSAAAHEKIRDFCLLAEPFSVENGFLTPTLKPRRRLIEQKFAHQIDEMYAAFA